MLCCESEWERRGRLTVGGNQRGALQRAGRRLTVGLLDLERRLQAHVAGNGTEIMWVCQIAALLVYREVGWQFCTA